MALDLVEPLIPDGNKSRGPDIFLQGLGQGLQAVTRMNESRRQSEMDMLRLAEHERLAEEQMALERDKMAQDFDLRQQALDVNKTVNDAHAEYYKAGAEAYKTGTKTAAQRAIAFNQQRQALVTDVNDQASRLQLDDPNFATKNPVQFAANVMQFEDMFNLSPLPEVKNAISVYRRTADQQKIRLRTGVMSEDGEIKPSGDGIQVPVWQIVKNLQDPETQEQTMNDLIASGHTRVVEEFQDFAGVKVPVKRTEPSPRIKSQLEGGKDVKFERVPSRVTPAMLPKSAADGTAPTELPAIPEDDPQASAGKPPQFSPTETDTLIAQAKGAIYRGAPSAAVAQRLQEMGIDASALWS